MVVDLGGGWPAGRIDWIDAAINDVLLHARDVVAPDTNEVTVA